SPAQAEKRPTEPTGSERLRAADKIAQQAGAVANDDRFPASRILYNLQSRSSSAPTWIAVGLSALWLLVSGAGAYMRYGNELGNLGQFMGTIDFIALIAIMFLPVAAFFAVA